MGLDIKNIDNATEKVVKSTNHGLWYYLATIFITVSVIVGSFIIGGLFQTSSVNPELSVTAQIFRDNGMVAIPLLAFFILGSYFSGVYINRKDGESRSHRLVKNVVDEEERRQDKRNREHDMLINYRFSIAPKISNILKDLIINLGAAKVCIFEMHNGTNNVSGVPFLFADMMYEEAKNSDLYTADEFKNLNLTRYGFIESHLREGSWCGSTEELQKEDPKLAEKLKAIDVEYSAMMLLQGVDKPLGFLQIYFDKSGHPSNKEILSVANAAAQKITSLIDKTVVLEQLINIE